MLAPILVLVSCMKKLIISTKKNCEYLVENILISCDSICLQSWYNAQIQCEQNGMEPLRLDSKDEELHFYSLIQSNPNVKGKEYFHIGGFKADGNWVWKSDQTKALPFEKWAPGEPNNDGDVENCLSIRKGDSPDETGFNDIPCERDDRGFFCQKTKNKPTAKPEPEPKPSSKKTALECEQKIETGVCVLLQKALNAQMKTGKDTSIESEDKNEKFYKSTTVSVTTVEYYY